MKLNNYPPCEPMPQLDLVVTRAPDGVILHPELGVFTSPWEAMEKLGQNYVYIPGSMVGLEWQTTDGTAIKENDFWSKCFYIPASYYPEDHIFTDMFGPQDKPKNIHITTLHKPSKKHQGLKKENVNRWLGVLDDVSDDISILIQTRKSNLG